jgi:hypothetical protein
MKKGKLNIELYHIHVKAVSEWGKLWYHIQSVWKKNTGYVRRNT